MAKFEFVKKYAETPPCNLPVRKTAQSAGYDFEIAEDIIVPSMSQLMDKFNTNIILDKAHTAELDDVNAITKNLGIRPTLVPTGVKCKLDAGTYLELSVRSSCPLKYWLILANGVGIIDADYYSNPDNDGEIFFQIINLLPFPIQLHKGDVIGQGIIKHFDITENDAATGERLGGFGSTSK